MEKNCRTHRGSLFRRGAGTDDVNAALRSEFLNKNNNRGGFWIEAVPVYPALAIPGFGDEKTQLFRFTLNLNQQQTHI